MSFLTQIIDLLKGLIKQGDTRRSNEIGGHEPKALQVNYAEFSERPILHTEESGAAQSEPAEECSYTSEQINFSDEYDPDDHDEQQPAETAAKESLCPSLNEICEPVSSAAENDENEPDQEILPSIMEPHLTEEGSIADEILPVGEAVYTEESEDKSVPGGSEEDIAENEIISVQEKIVSSPETTESDTSGENESDEISKSEFLVLGFEVSKGEIVCQSTGEIIPDISIKELGLKGRAYNAFPYSIKIGKLMIRSSADEIMLSDLLKMTQRDLHNLSSMGKKTAESITETVYNYLTRNIVPNKTGDAAPLYELNPEYKIVDGIIYNNTTENAVADVDIDHLGLDPEICKALSDCGIYRLSELIVLSLPQLLSLQKAGMRSLSGLISIITEYLNSKEKYIPVTTAQESLHIETDGRTDMKPAEEEEQSSVAGNDKPENETEDENLCELGDENDDNPVLAETDPVIFLECSEIAENDHAADTDQDMMTAISSNENDSSIAIERDSFQEEKKIIIKGDDSAYIKEKNDEENFRNSFDDLIQHNCEGENELVSPDEIKSSAVNVPTDTIIHEREHDQQKEESESCENKTAGGKAEFEIDASRVLTKYNGTGGNVILPTGVSGIGEESFAGNINIVSIAIPEGVEKVGGKAFCGCSALKEVSLPCSIIDIGEAAFKDTAVDKIVVPDGVQSIGAFAFMDCKNLKEVVLPKSVRSIGVDAFGNGNWDITIFVEKSSVSGAYAQENMLYFDI